ncbi:formate dehydrogenase accessory sulfurtransferase FdhD [Oricola thermophila]|uniref:Sulfur carrier protein FdhD n=1 Tax=Oricola thermophila TaxID=2742145 RepID=A0A6N1V8P2_9HYPH|nr:formate dehydrogenase accessory sulfurtransferase FdhD [Oricola thermophila]QKV17304.1 formate dehydrogenase accessory sulfurtransferase FdhD [Oricola thermophila]
MSPDTVHPIERQYRRAGRHGSGPRMVAEETPVALTFNGVTHAVMMATPSDLEDFAVGFSLNEGIVGALDEIERIEIVEADNGIDLQIRLREDADERLARRRRAMAGPVGCGLCGVESIEEAVKPRAAVDSDFTMPADEITNAVAELTKVQVMNAETGAVHAAGFWSPEEGVVLAREDVGRHNALDKLAGALARVGTDCGQGAVLLTSRVSVEMIQKTAAIGAPIVLAISAPTALAVRTAVQSNITLVAVVRGEDHEIFTHPRRITNGEIADVA